MRNNLILRSRDDVPHYLRPLEKKTTGVDAELQDKMDQYSGDRLKFLEQERFAWNLIENQKQAVVNSAALPTATELLFRKGKKAAEEKQKELASAIEELYGKQEATPGEEKESPEEAAEEAARWLDDTRRKDDPAGDESETDK